MHKNAFNWARTFLDPRRREFRSEKAETVEGRRRKRKVTILFMSYLTAGLQSLYNVGIYKDRGPVVSADGVAALAGRKPDMGVPHLTYQARHR